MSLEAALRSRLLANATITTASGGKVAWDERTGLPAVMLSKVAPGQLWAHDGPNPLRQPRVQVDCFGATSTQAHALANAVRDEMERTDEVTAGGWTFLPPAILNLELSRTPDDLPGGGKAYFVTQDYTFWTQPAE